MKIKICGITNFEDAKTALDLGADALGFNFFSGSPRLISVNLASQIRAQLGRNGWIVGIFCNHPLQEVMRIARAVPLDAVQLHGDETETECAALRDFTVIKAFRLADIADIDRIAYFGDSAAFYLFEGFASGNFGGTGTAIAPDIVRRLQTLDLFARGFLSGGLNPDNIADLVAANRPYGVDVASGVEEAPGRKSRERLKAFIDSARAALR